MPNGKEAVFQPLGLAYYDPASGKSVSLGTVKSATGVLTVSNEVVFSNCFTGIKASIRIRNSSAGVEHDAVLHEQPPTPASLGLSPATRLEMWTEQLQGGQPKATPRILRHAAKPKGRARAHDFDFVDNELDFGGMKMPGGKAFAAGPRKGSPLSLVPSPVAKSLEIIQGRRVLVEAVEYRRAEPMLKQLPRSSDAEQGRVIARIAESRSLPVLAARPLRPADGEANEPRPQTARISPILDNSLLVSAATQEPAFVLDFQLVNPNGENNFTFKSDTTYRVSSSYTALYGVTTFEGGTVIKYDEGATLVIEVGGSVVCDTTNHLPAVFTTHSDNSVGETVTSGSATPNYTYGLAFVSGNSHDLHDLHFRYIQNPFYVMGTVTIRNLQVDGALTVFDCSGSDTINLYNALITGSYYVVVGWSPTFRGEHLTFHNSGGGTLAYIYQQSGASAAIKNSLFAGMDIPPSTPYASGTYTEAGTYSVAASAPVFQTVEGGSHYLVDTTYRNIGVTTIEAGLASNLRELTTFAPTLITGTLTTDQTWLPTVQRDTDAPDIGYHYPPIDYIVRGVSVQNASVTMSNGVVVAAAFNPPNLWSAIGLSLYPGKLTSMGTPTVPNRIIRACQVQENIMPRGLSIMNDGPLSQFRPEFTARFTEVSSLAGEYYGIYFSWDIRAIEFSHCSVSSPLGLGLYGGSLQKAGLTNNLVRRAPLYLWGTSPVHFHLYNNLFKDAAVHFYGDAVNFKIFDNCFDNTTLLEGTDEWGNYIIHENHPGAMGYNAFVGIDNIPLRTLAGSFFLGTLTYANGPLGRYYVPGNSLRTPGGSRLASAASLYHFTTEVNQTPEGTSQVDIGYHYASLGVNGLPLDTDTDGIPNYVEDLNGNGTYESTVDLINFAISDTDGDGLPDGWEWLYGLNGKDATGNNGSLGDQDADSLTNLQEYSLALSPILNQAAQSSARRNYIYDRLNRLDNVTGVGQVDFTLDKEGNITNVAP